MNICTKVLLVCIAYVVCLRRTPKRTKKVYTLLCGGSIEVLNTSTSSVERIGNCTSDAQYSYNLEKLNASEY